MWISVQGYREIHQKNYREQNRRENYSGVRGGRHFAFAKAFALREKVSRPDVSVVSWEILCGCTGYRSWAVRSKGLRFCTEQSEGLGSYPTAPAVWPVGCTRDSQQGGFLPLKEFVDVWRHFWLSQLMGWGCLLASSAWSPRCCWTPYSAQKSPPCKCCQHWEQDTGPVLNLIAPHFMNLPWLPGATVIRIERDIIWVTVFRKQKTQLGIRSPF